MYETNSRHKLLPEFLIILTITLDLQFSRSFFSGKNCSAFDLLERTNQKCQRIWRFYFKFILVGFVLNNAMTFLASILLCYLRKKHFDQNYVYRTFRLT